MKVQDLCRRKPNTCLAEANLAVAVAKLWEGDSGALIVVDASDRPVAVLTDRDIAIALGTRDVPASAIRVSEVMSKRLYTCLVNDDVRTAIRIMVRNGVRRLPVIDQEAHVAGMLSVNDLVLEARPARTGKSEDLTWADLVPALDVLFRPSRSRIPDNMMGEAAIFATVRA
ncbi:MAG: CBS domain-containing protein [Planctomycetota bacterium]